MMSRDLNRYHRRSIRMKGYDYSLPGGYFVTLVAKDRRCIFGIVEGGKIHYSDIGELVANCWLRIPNHFNKTWLDEYVIMPNHMHGIIFIEESIGKGEVFADIGSMEVEVKFANTSPQQPRGTIPGSLSSIIQNFKLVSTRMVNNRFFEPGNKIWQRNYYERIIRNERELNAIRQYVRDNPLNWEQDVENSERYGRTNPRIQS